MKQRFTIRCSACGHRWKTIATKPPTKCPNLDCGESIINRGIDLTSNKAPAQIGQNAYVRAADLTAEMTMRDYGMDNLQGGGTGLRQGDVMAPKLPAPLQEKADNFFGAPRKGRAGSLNGNAAVSSAMAAAGATNFAPTIQQLHRERVAPPIKIVAG